MLANEYTCGDDCPDAIRVAKAIHERGFVVACSTFLGDSGLQSRNFRRQINTVTPDTTESFSCVVEASRFDKIYRRFGCPGIPHEEQSNKSQLHGEGATVCPSIGP